MGFGLQSYYLSDGDNRPIKDIDSPTGSLWTFSHGFQAPVKVSVDTRPYSTAISTAISTAKLFVAQVSVIFGIFCFKFVETELIRARQRKKLLYS